MREKYEEPESDFLSGFWAELREPRKRKAFVDACRERYGWRFSYRQAANRIAQWESPDDHHRLPAESLGDGVRIIGHANFLDPLLALELRLRKARPAKVEPGMRRSA